jgi:hypothetical protein
MQKQERKEELEPLQEQATHVIAQLEEENTSRSHEKVESTTLIQEDITTQTIEFLTKNVL